MDRDKARIGTSGWNYSHWRGAFYPADLPRSRWQSYYMARFNTVEVNNTFYRLPEKQTFAKWKQEAEEGFIFSVKASRYITHMKKLKDPEEPAANFLEHAGGLGEKLGPVLFQLPPQWKANPGRLDAFLGAIPAGFRYAFEFRDNTWWDPEIYELLTSRGAAFCIFDLEGRLSPLEVTADFVYVRLHGPGSAYQGDYSDRTLSEWAGRFRGWLEAGIEVYCYFDNDENGYAAKNALRIKELL
jgi:uncharacterized protein YecE (DUF72 family)